MLKFLSAVAQRFGLELRKADLPQDTKPAPGMWRRLFDWATGAWQADAPYDSNGDCNITLNSVVFACLRLLSQDVSKCPPIAQEKKGSIWTAVEGQLLARPNPTQSWMEFIAYWVLCKLIYGNAYVLKFRTGDAIKELWLLDPRKTQPVIALRTGRVFYKLSVCAVEQITEDVVVAADEIIHDKELTLWHPLVGVARLEAARLAATAGTYGIRSLQKLATNGGVPAGMLIIPSGYTEEQIAVLSARWETLRQQGRTAIMESGITFTATAVKAVDAQYSELIGFTGKMVCTAFGVPPWKVGLEPMPAGVIYGQLQVAYYEGSPQYLIHAIEQHLTDGLELKKGVRIVLDLSPLQRMDEKSRWEMYKVAAIAMKPDEMRIRENMEPVPGGDAVYSQQQNFSLEALAKRDAKEDPFKSSASGGAKPGAPSPDSPEPTDNPVPPPDQAMDLLRRWRGVWKKDTTYARGDLVTHHGLWVAALDVRGEAKPGDSKGWRLLIGEKS